MYSSLWSVLTDDEKELGICLIDIGGGTTDIAVFGEGSIQHTAVIPIAGDQVTNDIAVALRISTQAAEAIKIKHGCALLGLVSPNEMIEIPSMSDKPARHLSLATLSEVIEPRYEELFLMVRAELQRMGLVDRLGSGIVVTGGSAKMNGVIDLAEEIFQLPVRLGVPRHVTGLPEVVSNPIYATGVGLLLYGLQQQLERPAVPMRQGLPAIVGRMKRWFQGRF